MGAQRVGTAELWPALAAVFATYACYAVTGVDKTLFAPAQG